MFITVEKTLLKLSNIFIFINLFLIIIKIIYLCFKRRLRTRKIIENNNDVGLYEELRQIDHENIVKMVGSRIQDNYRLTEFVYEVTLQNK